VLKKLSTYLLSPEGKNEILNPVGKKPIRRCIFRTEEITKRFRKGVTDWIKGENVVDEIETLDRNVTEKVKDVQIELQRVQVSITGRELEKKIKVTFIDFDFASMIAVITIPIGRIFGDTDEKDIDRLYDWCVHLLTTVELPTLIRSIFNDHFQHRIEGIFEKDLPEAILNTMRQISYLTTERDKITNNLQTSLRLRDSLDKIKGDIEKMKVKL
jgi:hypothetical protein